MYTIQFVFGVFGGFCLGSSCLATEIAFKRPELELGFAVLVLWGLTIGWWCFIYLLHKTYKEEMI